VKLGSLVDKAELVYGPQLSRNSFKSSSAAIGIYRLL
jgi:hypothetical protein